MREKQRLTIRQSLSINENDSENDTENSIRPSTFSLQIPRRPNVLLPDSQILRQRGFSPCSVPSFRFDDESRSDERGRCSDQFERDDGAENVGFDGTCASLELRLDLRDVV